MKNFDATGGNGASLHCVVCEREIRDGNWFARVKLGEGRVAICRPLCAEIFAEHPERFAFRASPATWVEKVAAG